MGKPSVLNLLSGSAAVVVASAGLASGGPADAMAATKRPSCDRLGGRTLAANERVRVFRVSARGSEVRIRACSYRTNRAADLGFDQGPSAGPTSFRWAINGDFVAISASDPGTDEPTDRSAGISTESLTIWNGRTRRTVKPDIPTVGLRFSELVVSPRGSVAAIGNPFRFAGLTDAAPGRLTESYVRVFEPTSRPEPGSTSITWRTVATAPERTLTGLAVSGNRLVWSDAAGVQQVPIL